MRVTEAGNPIYNREVWGKDLVLEGVGPRAQVGACHFPVLRVEHQDTPFLLLSVQRRIHWMVRSRGLKVLRSCT